MSGRAGYAHDSAHATLPRSAAGGRCYPATGHRATGPRASPAGHASAHAYAIASRPPAATTLPHVTADVLASRGIPPRTSTAGLGPHTARAFHSPIPPSRSCGMPDPDPVDPTPSTPGKWSPPDSPTDSSLPPGPTTGPSVPCKQSSPAPTSIRYRRRHHHTDPNPAPAEDRPFHVNASQHGVLRRGRADPSRAPAPPRPALPPSPSSSTCCHASPATPSVASLPSAGPTRRRR